MFNLHMQGLMLELRELQYFVAIAERLSVTRAAKAMNLSQPALSRQLQSLEHKLGVTLFERVGKRLVLTAEGDDLLIHASQLIDHAQELINRAYGLEQGHVGLLRVCATPQTITGLFSPVLAEFGRLHPNVELIISEAHNDGLLDLVDNGGAHLAVAGISPGVHLAGEHLFDAELLAIVPPGHFAHGRNAIAIQELAEEKFLVLRRGYLTRRLFDQACVNAGLRPRILLESDSAHTIITLARDGHGVAILSSSTRNADLVRPSVTVTVGGRKISSPVSAVWNPNRYRPASLSAFVRLLVQHARQGLDG